MESLYQSLRLFTLAVLLTALFGGCQDKCVQTMIYTIYEPVYMTKAEFYSAVRLQAPQTPSQPGKIYLKDNFLFVSERNKGIHIINNRNPRSPQPVGFINIPGNVDMAMNGGILYADSRMDLLAIDINDPANSRVVGRVNNVFPHTQIYPGPWVLSRSIPQPDTSRIIVDWIKREERTVNDCAELQTGWIRWGGGWGFALAQSSFSADSRAPGGFSSGAGIGGSMARFAVVNDFLYTVDNTTLRVFDVKDAPKPVFRRETWIQTGGGVAETIFPYEQSLFFGTTTGMSIYSIANPDNPTFVGLNSHFLGCDPVVVQGNYAYVTVKGGTDCRSQWPSQLEVVDISNMQWPRTLKTYPMEDPNGLGIDGNTLFICDGKAGLKVYDIADRMAIDRNLLGRQPAHAYDVIPFRNTLMVVGNDGLYQYDYANPRDLKLLSVIKVTKSE